MGRESIGRFLEYFSKPLNNEQLIYLNNINGVMTERVELYTDFIVSLSHITYDTYLGDDIMGAEEQSIHFNWCWNKNIDNFEKENIFINRRGEHYNYFFNYFNDVFYSSPEKNKLLLTKIIQFWYNIFSLIKNKTKSEYDLFIELYRLMGKYFINQLDTNY